MIDALFLLVESLFGESLLPWARWFHLLALASLLAAWGRPLGGWAWGRWVAPRPRWATSWVCPSCGHPNPTTTFLCEKCAEGPGPAWWRKLRVRPWFLLLRQGSRVTALSLRIGGQVVFYSVTFLAAYRFRLFSFNQQPLQELLAGAAMLVLLAAIFLAHRAVAGGALSPVGRVVDLLSAGTAAGVFLALWILWAAAPFPPGKPLAVVAVTPDGIVRIHGFRERRTQSVVNPATQNVILPIEYARFTWPVLMVDRVFIIRLAAKPLVTWMGGKTARRLARSLTDDAPHKPRLVVLRQVMEVRPPGTYAILRSRSGEGLTVEGPS